MKDRKPKNVFKAGAISTEFIAESISWISSEVKEKLGSFNEINF